MRKFIILLSTAMLCLSSCQESLEERAAKEAATYTKKNCPQVMSDMLDMDSMTFDKSTHTFGYHYTMKNGLDNEEVMRPEAMRQELLEGIKNMTSARAYMDEGYRFRYVYRSQQNPGKILFETLFTEKDYQ